MFFSVQLPRLLSVHARVRGMAACCMRVVRCFLVMTGFVVFGGFTMMPRRMGVVFRGFGVMFRSFLGHWTLLNWKRSYFI
jgi:hypothetical protein